MLRCCLPAIRCLGVLDGCATVFIRPTTRFVGFTVPRDEPLTSPVIRDVTRHNGLRRDAPERSDRPLLNGLESSPLSKRDNGLNGRPILAGNVPAAGSENTLTRGVSTTEVTSCSLDVSTSQLGSGECPREASAIVDSNAGSDRYPALQVLMQFLRTRDFRAADAPRHSPNTLRSLFTSIKHRSQLNFLRPADFSALASIFGTLSIPEPRPQCIYMTSRVSYLPTSPARTYWPFVVQVLREKRQLGHHLVQRDHFWLMRATLAQLDLNKSSVHVESNLSRAQYHYERVKHHSTEADVHLPYFLATLNGRPDSHSARLSEVIRLMRGLLPRLDVRDVWFPNFLWTLVIKHFATASAEHRHGILDTVCAPIAIRRAETYRDDLLPSDFPHHSRIMSAPVDLNCLSMALSHAVAPSSTAAVPALVQHWAANVAQCALGTHLSVDTRWRNLTLLALYHTIRDHPESSPTVESPPSIDPHAMVWETVLTLAIIEKGVGREYDASDNHSPIRELIRTQWKAWKNSCLHEPALVARAVMASFFRLAAVTADVRLKEALHKYCLQRDLYQSSHASDAVTAQARDLMAEYIVASQSCGSTRWADALSSIGEAGGQPELIDTALRLLIRRSVPLAQSLYRYAQGRCLPVSPGVVHAIAMTFASSPSFQHAIRHLTEPLSIDLLNAILHSFLESGQERLSPGHIQTIARAMSKTYALLPPSPDLKHPIRNMLLVIAGSPHASETVSIVKHIQRRRPSFFTARFLRRFLAVLLRCRQFRSAVRILAIASPNLNTSALRDLREAVVLRTAYDGAHSQARIAYSLGRTVGLRPSPRESLFNASRLQGRTPRRLCVMNVVAKAYRSVTNVALVIDAVMILARAKRFFAARKLFRHACKQMDARACTRVGNIILNGLVQRSPARNGRLVRTVMRTTEYLASDCGFVRDRVTVNILLKALLRWNSFIGVPEVKQLFDHMIRGGYPAAPRFRRDDVPFATPPHTTSVLSLPPVRETISFYRHARPMYKMFVKAFHLRGDKRAAAMVIGILKAEEAAVRERRETRNRARLAGRLKARTRQDPAKS
ncbi:hypothetical protein HGRIS_003769 [Hohenbuehelia grisea]|uniref:Uncharacterized protein n=1 Tax=Hohenbuehelia grisea TaxID=104357 RepID=A0ABR3JGC0_9AGAR